MQPPRRNEALGYGILGLLLIGALTIRQLIGSRPKRLPFSTMPEDAVVYLEVDDVLSIFAEHMKCSAAEARRMLYLPDRLQAALARPESYQTYEDADLAVQAAVLAHGIVKNHAFEDGNKRTALVTMVEFLMINGLVLPNWVSQEEREDWMLDLEHADSFEQLARRLRGVLQPIP